MHFFELSKKWFLIKISNHTCCVKKKMCGKFKYFPRLHSEKICFFKKKFLSLLFKNKRVTVILSQHGTRHCKKPFCFSHEKISTQKISFKKILQNLGGLAPKQSKRYYHTPTVFVEGGISSFNSYSTRVKYYRIGVLLIPPRIGLDGLQTGQFSIVSSLIR